MRSSLKLLSCLAVLTMAAGQPGVAKGDKDADKAAAAADKKKADDKKKKAKEKEKEKKKAGDQDPAADAADNGPRLNLPLVPHHPATGLKIPYTDANGKLQMIYYIGTATRLDEDKVDMKDSKVETYNDEGEVEMTVDLPVSQLNLKTKIVTSDTKTTITREDFIVTGDSVKFNTVSKQAALVGHVHMTVYDLKDESATPPPAHASEPTPTNE